jgi:microcystin-dependent protein
MSEPFMSEIRIMSFNFAPRNWALCNGQILAINQNAALFALVGTNYGGNGINTFALPNLQGNFVCGNTPTPALPRKRERERTCIITSARAVRLRLTWQSAGAAGRHRPAPQSPRSRQAAARWRP